jgi:glycosyltransferase involved in cell wall biosynthesis
MKVLQVLTHLNIGGITTYVYTLSKYLLKNNIEVGIASSGGDWEEKFKDLGVNVFRINIKTKSELSSKLLISLSQLFQIKRKFNFQILHSHTRVTQVLCQIFHQLSGIPHVANFHGFYTQHKKRWGRKILKAQGNVSVAITPEVKNDLINIFGAKENRVKVIVSGIDLENLKEGKPLNLEGFPKIGSSGRLSKIKGFEYLLKSIPLLIEKYPQIFLYILGEGKEEEKLVALAKDLKIEERFKIVKKIELFSFLRSLDIFCLPSLEEPLGLSILEAQYVGVPCVASCVGGLKILIENLKTGILVPPKQPQKIAAAIDFLIKNEILRKEIQENAKKKVLEKFDFSKKVKDFIEIYEKVLR